MTIYEKEDLIDFYPRPPRGGRLCATSIYTNMEKFLSTPSARRATVTSPDARLDRSISIHALREEGDHEPTPEDLHRVHISIHALREEGDADEEGADEWESISIHALREEGDDTWHIYGSNREGFLSTPSARRATTQCHESSKYFPYFYPRPPRGGRRLKVLSPYSPANFYPRPPRGGRRNRLLPGRNQADFYPRPPRGGRPRTTPGRGCRLRFLSTPSARRATALASDIEVELLNFYPRPPRGGRRLGKKSGNLSGYFYPRPPRGGRHAAGRFLLIREKFLSTPSARRATKPLGHHTIKLRISIHALREEGDAIWVLSRLVSREISIHALREEGDVRGVSLKYKMGKISIHALREEGDRKEDGRSCQQQISIHALREEGDRRSPAGCSQGRNFYPRPPRGGRLGRFMKESVLVYFYPRPPRGGRPRGVFGCFFATGFLSTPSARRATRSPRPEYSPGHISIHALREEGDRFRNAERWAARGFLSTPSARRATSGVP